MPTTIRRAAPADATQAAEVFVASRATMTYLPRLHTDDETRAFVRETVSDKETWVAERDGRVVGFAVIDGGWLEHLYVHPSRFNSETGSKLFAKVTSHHPQGFQLWVFQQNAGARRFYERQSCALVRLTDGGDNEEKLPDALYIWPGDAESTKPAAPAMKHARGTFEVKPTPLTNEDQVADPLMARMAINKTFHGDLEATSKGQMLTAGTVTKGSAVYVAVEKVTGTLRGRGGSFLLHHQGIMTRGVPQLSVAIVPDSGTDALKGISGTLAIRVADGKHSYELDYSFEEGAKA